MDPDYPLLKNGKMDAKIQLPNSPAPLTSTVQGGNIASYQIGGASTTQFTSKLVVPVHPMMIARRNAIEGLGHSMAAVDRS